MKRLCVYVTYDQENTVDDYIGYMLQELRKIVDCLVVVCNYQGIAHGMNNIQPYADMIFYRENTGYDAGAYKDVFCRFLGWDAVCRYDELLLVNDSFFGPFYDLGDLFDRMEKTGVDYWGMTRCPEVELADGNIYETHIQSYFFVLANKILQNTQFRTFWEKMEYPQSLLQAIIRYEIGINALLQKLGFTGISAMDVCSTQWNLRKNENPHILYPLELIRDAGIPVLKRKSLNLANKRFGDAMGALKFIRDERAYDICLIEEHIRRTGKGGNYMGIDEFYASHAKVFIYGAGFYGRNLAEYFAYKGWPLEKFIVTYLNDKSENCISFEEADISGDDGIVIAAGSKRVFSEILPLVETRCRKDQIFNRDIIL